MDVCDIPYAWFEIPQCLLKAMCVCVCVYLGEIGDGCIKDDGASRYRSQLDWRGPGNSFSKYDDDDDDNNNNNNNLH